MGAILQDFLFVNDDPLFLDHANAIKQLLELDGAVRMLHDRANTPLKPTIFGLKKIAECKLLYR